MDRVEHCWTVLSIVSRRTDSFIYSSEHGSEHIHIGELTGANEGKNKYFKVNPSSKKSGTYVE